MGCEGGRERGRGGRRRRSLRRREETEIVEKGRKIAGVGKRESWNGNIKRWGGKGQPYRNGRNQGIGREGRAVG